MTNKTPITLEDLKPLCKRLKLAALYEHALVLQEQSETLVMSHVEWLHELLIAETSRRETNALKRRLSIAELEFRDCCMEGIDYEVDRGLDRQMMAELGTCDWIRKHQNCIITGKTGCGKTWMAGALVHAACLQGFSAKCVRMSTL